MAVHDTNLRLRDEMRAGDAIATNRSTVSKGMSAVFTDPEVQDQVAREMVEVARLQKQCLILKKSNASLKAQKSVRCQALLKKLDEKQLDMEMM